MFVLNPVEFLEIVTRAPLERFMFGKQEVAEDSWKFSTRTRKGKTKQIKSFSVLSRHIGTSLEQFRRHTKPTAQKDIVGDPFLDIFKALLDCMSPSSPETEYSENEWKGVLLGANVRKKNEQSKQADTALSDGLIGFIDIASELKEHDLQLEKCGLGASVSLSQFIQVTNIPMTPFTNRLVVLLNKGNIVISDETARTLGRLLSTLYLLAVIERCFMNDADDSSRIAYLLLKDRAEHPMGTFFENVRRLGGYQTKTAFYEAAIPNDGSPEYDPNNARRQFLRWEKGTAMPSYATFRKILENTTALDADEEIANFQAGVAFGIIQIVAEMQTWINELDQRGFLFGSSNEIFDDYEALFHQAHLAQASQLAQIEKR